MLAEGSSVLIFNSVLALQQVLIVGEIGRRQYCNPHHNRGRSKMSLGYGSRCSVPGPTWPPKFRKGTFAA
eukprot:1875216-Prorocentrum_lima.AAC.1